MKQYWSKLFSSIVTSTIWQEPLHVKVVWITMLALKDRDGNVAGSVPGLAHMAGVTMDQCQEALKKFKAPDEFSRTKEHEGRRIEEVAGGWKVLNHFLYRDETQEARREYQRVKQSEYRARRRKIPAREAAYLKAEANGAPPAVLDKLTEPRQRTGLDKYDS